LFLANSNFVSYVASMENGGYSDLSLGANNMERVRILGANGNVGIGTASPKAQLSVVSGTDNNGAFFPATNAAIVGADNTIASLSANLTISSNSTAGPNVGANIGLGGRWLDAGDPRDLEFATIKGAKENSTPGDGSGYLAFGTYGTGGMVEKMRIASSGNVGIGTTSPDQKLTVKGTIHSQEVIVDMNVLPDYVFKPAYHLPTLNAVKAYIDQNHHLPEMPSAEQVAKDGLSLGDMNAKLLKNVEELTLYLIENDNKDKEKDARLNSQEERLRLQQEQINEFKQQLNAITTTLNKN